jgi:hypothetical protein
MITTTTTTIYPPLPELTPRGAQETTEQYGLRALLFITAERLTCTVDTEGLEQAAHCFRLAVSNAALTPTGAERLADVGRSITGALARRQADAQAAAPEAQAPAQAAGEDRPNLGPMAPLTPAPRPSAPPSAARRVPSGRTPFQAPTLAPVVAPALALAADDLF